jgi:hypothetical protein
MIYYKGKLQVPKIDGTTRRRRTAVEPVGPSLGMWRGKACNVLVASRFKIEQTASQFF